MARDLDSKMAEYLASCRLLGDLIRHQPETDDIDEQSGYQIQNRLHELLVPRMGRLVGHKIGCTTPVMQRYLAIDQPCAGGIFTASVLYSNGSDSPVFPASRSGRLGAECEIAVRLGADIDPTHAPYDRVNIQSFVESVMPAIEIVEDRYQDYSNLSASFLIADDFFNTGCVLGDATSNWQDLDLAGLQGRLWVNDSLRGQGAGADILGHPMQALAWLANHRSALGLSLCAGEFVLLGSVVQTQWLEPGDQVRIELETLGAVSFTVNPAAPNQ